MKPSLRVLTLALPLFAPAVFGEPLLLSVAAPAPASTAGFRMGAAGNPAGQEITLDNRSLRLDGRPWTPVMGEFHYSRYPAAEWREELRKMKAGGIDIVATYVFWIHHEEIEGEWQWTGDKDLRRFIAIAGEVGLKAIVRCGPWCHGEVRNGGLPDWILVRGGKVRSDDPAYLGPVTRLYGQIATQLHGLLWKDGGPVVGIQLDNEYGGPAQHLLSLKGIARAAGLDVPLYTRTGWPELATPMPFGEIAPLYGVYAEGFWDRETTSMPGNYWAGFHFSTLRNDANIANDALGRRDVHDEPDVARYPYLTCEIGGGMMSSYHRRILVDPRDIESTTLVKLGSGSTSPGYYMYHGGTNPEGRLTTLMEEQATPLTNWNDMPVKNYDFQTALGQYGQVRPQYHLLRRLHLFLHDFGDRLAGMGTHLPAARPRGKDDVETLRWSVRSDGEHGFLFVNNYERGRSLPAKENVQFQVRFTGRGPLDLPTAPVTVPSGAIFFWPLNFDLGAGGNLAWATAQPIALAGDEGERTYYFAEIPGIPAEFVFTGARVNAVRGRTEIRGDGHTRVLDVTAGRDPALITNSSTKIVLLSRADSLALARDPETGRLGFLPPPDAGAPLAVGFELVRPAGPARTISLGPSPQPVAAAPTAADFAAAARYRIKLPAGLDPAATDLLLRLHYVGDVARVLIGDTFITDDYYNGNPLEIGLRRHATALQTGELTLAILPLRQDAITGARPLIFLNDTAKPDFGAPAAAPAPAGTPTAAATLRAADLVPRTSVLWAVSR